MKTTMEKVFAWWKTRHKADKGHLPNGGFVLTDGTVIAAYGNHDELCKPFTVADAIRHGALRFHVSTTRAMGIDCPDVVTHKQAIALSRLVKQHTAYLAIVSGRDGQHEIYEPRTGTVRWAALRTRIAKVAQFK